MKTIARSRLRTKVFLLAALNLAVLAAAIAVFFAGQFGREFDGFLLGGGASRMQGIAREVESLSRVRPETATRALINNMSARYGVTMVLAENTGRVLAGPVTSLPPRVAERLAERPPPPDARGRRGPPPTAFLVRDDASPRFWAGVRIPIEHNDRPGPRRGTLFFVSDRFYTDKFFFDPVPIAAFAGVAVLLTALCWVPFIRRMTRDIARMDDATARIAAGRFDQQAGVTRGDELGHLAVSIDSMAARLSDLLQHQKRFLGDTAHELRSPLARMQMGLDLLDVEGGETVSKRAAALRGEVEEMRALTDALLDAAKLDAATREAPVERIALRDVIDEAVRREHRPGADIQIRADGDLEIAGRREPLTRALANILRNAVFYPSPAGPIEVVAERGTAGVTIAIADRGPGVPPDALERLFTPFYRVDPSRARQSGGAGLGLSIARAAIEGSGGRVWCRNRVPSGLEVIVDLPFYEDPRVSGQAVAREVRRPHPAG